MVTRLVRFMAVVATLMLGVYPLFARQPIIQIIAVIDYPGTGNSTTAHEINSRGDIAGTYVNSTGRTYGFTRMANGTFSDPIIETDFTFTVGINKADELAGYYFDDVAQIYHGLFVNHGFYIQYNAPGAINTFVLQVNNAGDFCGAFDDSTGRRNAFVSLGGTFEPYTFTPSGTVEANALNASDQIVGEYYDAPPATTFHGYFRDSNGTLTYPIDYPGSTSTILLSLNDKGISVGRYLDDAGMEHGLIVQNLTKLASYDYPGAIGTSLNGVNNGNMVSGRYTDTNGVRHGFLGRIR
ncbi:MAG: hypothetical protein ACREIF_18400 [Chthoniobacterales bacterium]